MLEPRRELGLVPGSGLVLEQVRVPEPAPEPVLAPGPEPGPELG